MSKKSKKIILKKFNTDLKRRGYTEIQSVLHKRNTPEKIVEERTGEICQPDIVAHHNGSVLVYKIGVADEIEKNTDRFIRTCKAIQQYVRKRKGRFSLIVPTQKFDTCLSLLNKNNLEKIGLLQLKMD